MSWPPGWYGDPWNPGNSRWWDGSTWTEHASAGAGPTDAATTGTARRKRRVWPWLVGGLLVLLLLAGGAVALIAALGSDDNQVARKPPRPSSTPTTPEYHPPNSHRLPAVDVGQSVRMADDDGHRIEVTVVNLVDPAPQGDYFTGPKRGKRWVGVRMRVRGDGPGTYNDDVSNGVRVVTSNGRYEAEVAELDACPPITSEVNLSPGQSATGCVIVPVPKGEKPLRITYTPASGYAADRGTWRVP